MKIVKLTLKALFFAVIFIMEAVGSSEEESENPTEVLHRDMNNGLYDSK